MKLRVHRGAEADTLDALLWYESKKEGLGLDFVGEVDALIESIQKAPESFPRLETSSDETIRRARLLRFPYLIIYELFPDEIHVLAIQHAARKPRTWITRRVP